jgi:hypothetical protein
MPLECYKNTEGLKVQKEKKEEKEEDCLVLERYQGKFVVLPCIG